MIIGKARTASIVLALAIGSTTAHAAWIPIVDVDWTDSASNPDGPSLPGGQPSNQGTSGTSQLALWLQDLLNLPTAPTLLASADSFSGSSITGIASGAQYLTLHYGNLLGLRNVTAAFGCSTGCESFTGYTTQGLSNYRIFGTAPTSSVPEPATLGLLGAGLLGLGLSRRRRRT